MCSHDPKTCWGFDFEDGCFRCCECGELVKDPPRWLKEKCQKVVEEFIQKKLKALRQLRP